ncbi:MAG: RNA polymerase sigma factor [Actinomycetota bacterium]
MTIPPETDVRPTLVSDLDCGFTVLVRTYQPGIYSGALRLTHSREDAQEVAQDTFLRAYTALGKYDEDRIRNLRVRPWLWTIAVNLCRTRTRRARPTSPLPPDETLGGEPDDHFDDTEWNRRLGTLSQPQRTAVILRHVADLGVSEIAAITDRPAGTVKADISRGLAKLRTIMEQEATT